MNGRFDAETARRWRAAAVPSWLYRWVLPALWTAAIVASVLGDDGRCSVDDPAVCGPDRTFSIWVVVCLATVALQWWVPSLGWTCGVLFALADLRYDDVRQAQFAWTVVGAACLVLLSWAAVVRVLQARIDRDLARVSAHADRARIGITWRLLAACVLLAVGAVSLSVMGWMDRAEARHIERSVIQDATVRSVADDGDLRLELPDGTRRSVTPLDSYPAGTVVPVRVDPADDDWIRLVAEPADNTYWYTVTGCVWFAALVLGYRDIRRRRIARLGPGLRGVPVRIRFDERGRLAVFGTDDESALAAYLPVDYDDPELDAIIDAIPDDDLDSGSDPDFDSDDDEDDPVDVAIDSFLGRYDGAAILCGPLVAGSWPVVVTPAGALRPIGPLRTPRTVPRFRRMLPGRHGAAPGERFVAPPASRPPRPAGQPVSRSWPEVTPASDLPDLPWSVRPSEDLSWNDWLLFVAALAAPVVVPWIAAEDDDPVGSVFLAVALGGGLLLGLGQLAGRLTVEPDGLFVQRALLRRFLAWKDIRAVTVRSRTLVIDTGEDDGGTRFRFADRETAQRTAAVIEAVRRRAGVGSRRSGYRLSWGAYVVAGYAIVLAVVLAYVLSQP